MRSEGQVRFIRVSSRLQIRIALGVTALAAIWLATMLGVAVSRLVDSENRLDLLRREARVLGAENRVAAARNGMAGMADTLRRRQDFIERVVQAHLGSLPAADPKAPAPAPAPKVSANDSATPLGAIESRQLALVQRLTAFAEHRSDSDVAQLRKLGVDPRMVLASAARTTGEGGPLLRMATDADGSLDPRFARLGQSLARMSTLETGLSRLPQVLPASLEYISSGFGYRSDPFTHEGAFHPGLDFRGPVGAPIYAAAPGKVSFVGQRTGYGNCVEVDHGNGLITRYAHMSAFRTHVGAAVHGGDVIGAIGSTGRSTGPHLHFEVRIGDRPVNPRPFLEARNTHVSEKIPGGRLAVAD